jgi:hypothetical protein
VTGFAGSGAPDLVATWVAAGVTIAVLGHLFGERRLFPIAQHLLAGLATGYLVLLAIHDVLVPRLVQPLVTDPVANVLLWPAAALALALAAARWLPRPVVAVPVAVIVGGTAAFAFGGAIAGTLLPQLAGAVMTPATDAGTVANGLLGVVITTLVLVAFLHGVPRGRVLGGAAGLGRMLVLGGVGGWLGFLIVSRLVLLVDRLAFLLNDWLRVSG